MQNDLHDFYLENFCFSLMAGAIYMFIRILGPLVTLVALLCLYLFLSEPINYFHLSSSVASLFSVCIISVYFFFHFSA